MEKLVVRRIENWKSLFTYKKQCNIQSNWSEILREIAPSKDKMLRMMAEAKDVCGFFSREEKQYINSLPYYTEILKIIRELPKKSFGEYFGFEYSNGDGVYFTRYPHFGEPENGVLQVDVVIVAKGCDSKIDMMSFSRINDEERRIITIRYAKEIPQEWLDLKAADDAEKQAS